MDGSFQSFLNMQSHKFFSKPQILPELYQFDVSVTISGKDFTYFYVLEESETVARKSSIKKVYLKIFPNSQKNICIGISFAIKLQARGL